MICDFSLAIVNRTGAFYLSQDIATECAAYFSEIRYWRFPRDRIPEGVIRKLGARLMGLEYRILKNQPFGRMRSGARKTLFLDPLYVLRAEFKPQDVVLCHDVGPITHSQFFPPDVSNLYRLAYTEICSMKPGMVFVSGTSRREFAALYGEDFRFMEVIPLYPRGIKTSSGRKPAVLGDHPFLLSVGATEIRKNYIRLIEAYSLSSVVNDFDLVICGPAGNGRAEVEAKAEKCPRVRLLGRVEDDELAWLYANASGFVSPSLLEGFGMPVIEAAYYQVPALVSRGSAQEEAIAGHAILVNCMDVDAIRNGLEQLQHLSAPERTEMTAAAKAHAQSLTRERFLTHWRELLSREAEN